MLDFINTHWDNILAVLAIFISIASFAQSQRLHNDNKKLTTLPNLDIELLYDAKIRGRIIRRENDLDQLNIWESKYTPFYSNHDLYFDDVKSALFTIVVKNVGNGVAKNIRIAGITISSNGKEISYKSNDILFTCSPEEVKANKIYINYSTDRIGKVEINVLYEDILNKTHMLNNTYAPISKEHSELKLLRSTNKKQK